MTTRCPGEDSFTSALIWALILLVRDQIRFTVSELANKIREGPHFPKDQVPVLFERSVASIERIILEPLSESDTNIAATSDLPMESSPQGLLNLNFIFERPPTRQGIERFGEALKLVWYRERMPIKRIVWGGLSSWEANPSSTGTSAIVIKAADKFKAGLHKKKVKGGGARRRSGQIQAKICQDWIRVELKQGCPISF